MKPCEQNILTLRELQNKPEACKYPSTSSLYALLETAGEKKESSK